MASNLIQASLFNPFLLWAGLAMKVADMMMSSGRVIGPRAEEVAARSAMPGADDLREMALKGTDDIKAATDSGLAIATRLQSTQYELLARSWQPWFTGLGAMNALAAGRAWGEALSRPSHLREVPGRHAVAQEQAEDETPRLASAARKSTHRATATKRVGRTSRRRAPRR